MTRSLPDPLRFVPSRVDGREGVQAVAVFPDRIVFALAQDELTLPFAIMGASQHDGHFVADRNFACPPPQRFFRFYTNPPITVFMPLDEPAEHEHSVLFKIEALIYAGGFETADLA